MPSELVPSELVPSELVPSEIDFADVDGNLSGIMFLIQIFTDRAV